MVFKTEHHYFSLHIAHILLRYYKEINRLILTFMGKEFGRDNKILHICTEDTKGAGLCAYRIHKTLLALGYDSKMLVYHKVHKNDDSVYAPYEKRRLFSRIFHRILRSLSIYYYEYDKVIRQSRDNKSLYSTPIGPIDISNNILVQEADLIHLHFVDFFFNQPLFFERTHKPIVWTLHDEGLFYGTSHYHDKILEDDKMEIKYKDVKKRMVENAHKLGIVFLSQSFARTFGESQMLKDRKCTVINNFVDTTAFTIKSRDEARAKFGIAKDIILFVFISADISDSHKGLNKLIEAIEEIGDKRMKILAIGSDRLFRPHPLVLLMGAVYNQTKLSELISASDFFVLPSDQEAFSQAPLEAMACGKPAIVFPFSGTEELINRDNGVCCKGFEVEDLVEGIHTALNRTYDSITIRNDVKDRFSPNNIINQYLNFYVEINNS